MKKLFKILGVLLIVVVVVLLAGFIYFNSSFPKTEAPAKINVEITKERIDRGYYLAHHVASCMDCHSQRDWSKFSAPPVAGTFGMGGDKFDEKMGFPGTIVAQNITPSAIGNWTDGELIRAITCGVNKDEDALFPLMPYPNYNKLTQEDLYSIVAYIRSLEPIKNEVQKTELNFPLNLIVKTIPPEKYTPAAPVDKSNTLEYGKYLLTIASCSDCHTPSVEGQPVEGMYLAGGSEFELPMGTVRSANLTPHESGLGNWTKELFIQKFKSYDPDRNMIAAVKENEFNSLMPWVMYAGMTEEDLGAIYDYLMSVKPVDNTVVKFTPRGEEKSLSNNNM